MLRSGGTLLSLGGCLPLDRSSSLHGHVAFDRCLALDLPGRRSIDGDAIDMRSTLHGLVANHWSREFLLPGNVPLANDRCVVDSVRIDSRGAID